MITLALWSLSRLVGQLKPVEMIQPLMSNISNVFWFRPPGGQAKNQIGPKFVL
jgi:hypothetical protein